MNTVLELQKFKEYKKGVETAKQKLIKNGEKFFVRENPNRRLLYETRWQVGIGNEKELLIDHHAAKFWDINEADIFVEGLNESYRNN